MLIKIYISTSFLSNASYIFIVSLIITNQCYCNNSYIVDFKLSRKPDDKKDGWRDALWLAWGLARRDHGDFEDSSTWRL